jgi:hypothetical protein
LISTKSAASISTQFETILAILFLTSSFADQQFIVNLKADTALILLKFLLVLYVVLGRQHGERSLL